MLFLKIIQAPFSSLCFFLLWDRICLSQLIKYKMAIWKLIKHRIINTMSYHDINMRMIQIFSNKSLTKELQFNRIRSQFQQNNLRKRVRKITKFIFIEEGMIFANLSFLCYNIEYLNLQNFDIRRYVRLVTSWRVWNAVWHKQYYHTKHISLHLITFHKLHWNEKHKK